MVEHTTARHAPVFAGAGDSVALAVGDRLRSGRDANAIVILGQLGALRLAPSSELGVVDMEWKPFGSGAAIGAVTVAVIAGIVDRGSEDAPQHAAAGHVVVLDGRVPMRSYDGAELERLRTALRSAETRIRELEAIAARTPVGPVEQPVQAPEVPAPESVLARLNAAWPLDEAKEIAAELGRLPDADLLRILRAIQGEIESAQVRQLVIESLLGSKPQLAVRLLHLIASDADEGVRRAALARLSDYAFFDLVADPTAYPAWGSRFADLPADRVMTTCAAEWVERLATLADDRLRHELERVAEGPLRLARRLDVDLAEVLRSAGLGEILTRAMSSGDLQVRTAAWRWSAATGGVDPVVVRQQATSMMDDVTTLPLELQRALFESLARQRAEWANALLRDALLAWPVEPDRPSHALWDIARALADAGDQRAIPAMIGMIATHGGYATTYGIGYFGLGPLTGVPYDESHDGAWWLDWWEQNRSRLPEPLRSQTIPRIRGGR